MQRDPRTMQEYIRQLYVSASTLDIVASVTVIILLTSFFEKVLGVNFIGRRILNSIWRVIRFIFRRLFSIFKPEVEKIKPGFDLLKKFATNSTEVEQQLASLLSIKKERSDQIAEINATLQAMSKSIDRQDEALIGIGETVHNMNGELQTNGGESLKDALNDVKRIVTDGTNDRKLIRIHLDIEDKLSDRMLFKLDEDGKCTFISNAFLRFFGWSESDMIGDSWMFCIDDRDAAIVDVKWEMSYKASSRYYNKQHIKDVVGVSHYCLVVAYPIIIDEALVGFRGVVEIMNEGGDKFTPKPLRIHHTE